MARGGRDGQWTLAYVRWGLGPHGPLGKEGRRGGPRTLGLFWAGQVGTSPQVWQERRRRGQKGKSGREQRAGGEGMEEADQGGHDDSHSRALSSSVLAPLSLCLSLFLFCISCQRHASAAGGVGITGYVVLTPGPRPGPSLSVPVGCADVRAVAVEGCVCVGVRVHHVHNHDSDSSTAATMMPAREMGDLERARRTYVIVAPAG